MKRLLFIIVLLSSINHVHSQTMHSLIFVNKEERDRQADRTAEFNNMTQFCRDIAQALGYTHDLRTHSGSEFTSTMMEREFSNLRVSKNDIVLFYYAGHGVNWDDDDWPHMAFLDRQYWETTAFSKLREVCSNAKLTLCIASCCNMDSRGRTFASFDRKIINPQRAKELFTGFDGQLSIITSSSIRGQYTYSWTSGNRLGSIYSISLRDEIYSALSQASSTPLNWRNILEATKRQTMAYTQNHTQPQQPQYRIYASNRSNSSKQSSTSTTNSQPSANTPTATVENTWIQHNVEIGGLYYMQIHVKFKTHYMTDYGGMVVAFFESPKGNYVRDTNGRYCTVEGNVCTYNNFGTHYEHSQFSDFTLQIPNEELHAKTGKHTYYMRVGVYDNKSKKYISFGDYISFTINAR